MLDAKQLANLKKSVHNVLKSGYRLEVDKYDIRLTIEDRLAHEDRISLVFDVLWNYGYQELKEAYANLRYIQ